jgi:CxxC-x17-CxxC domain-containing protein
MSQLLRGMAFIDFPNITSGGMPHGIYRLNFAGLAKVLTEGTRPVGVNAYIVDKGNRQGLFREIDRNGLKAEPVSPGKSVDGRLIFDLIVGAQRDMYDVGILASGDRDYVRVLQEAKRIGKQVWEAAFSNSIAPSLKACADRYIDLDQHTADISIPQKTFSATCADCGKPCALPFEPHLGKPVYCKDCFAKRKMAKAI